MPPVLANGFRPFFLLAAAVAVGAITAWLAVLQGWLVLHASFGVVDLHAHEMTFGFAGAVIAGFLLTAVKNWTGQAPATSGVLAGLVVLFVAGRAAVVIEAATGLRGLSILEAMFLPILTVLIAIPIIRTRSRRNFGVVGVVAMLAVMDLLMHIAAWTPSPRLGLGVRTGALLVPCVLLAVVGGRVIPLFTRNVVTSAGVVIRGPSPLDGLAIAGAVAAAVVSIGAPLSPIVTTIAPPVLLVAGIATVARMWGWGSTATFGTPILWILHLGHLALGVGFIARGVSFFAPTIISPSGALHILSIGALTVLCLGMMSRVALGHTGRPLTVGPAVVVAYVCLIVALVARIAATWAPVLLTVAGLTFALAFAIFFVAYAKILVSPRPDGKPG